MFKKLTQTIILCAAFLSILSAPTMAMAQTCSIDSDCSVDETCQETQCMPKPIFTGGDTPETTGIKGIETSLKDSQVVSTGNIRDLVFRYVNFALPLLALAAFVGFVYAGFLYVTAYGSEEQTGKAKNVMIYAVIGLILVILSYSIVQLFAKGLAEGIQK